jgi:hypothetical protein
MDKYSEEFQEPVSPHGQYFNSSVICSYVFGFLELAIPIDDDSQAIPLLKDVFLPINPRFSSIMVLHLFNTLSITSPLHFTYQILIIFKVNYCLLLQY